MQSLNFEENGEMSLQALFMDVNRRYAGKCFHQMMEFRVYPGQIPVLQLLASRDGYSQREIAEFLHIKPPTVNVTVQRLEKSGIVCRKQDAKDQRITRIYMTEKGRGIMKSAMTQLRENEKILFGNFSETELCLMRRFFRQMIQNIETMPDPVDNECIRKEE